MVKPSSLYRLNVIDSIIKRAPKKDEDEHRIQIQLVPGTCDNIILEALLGRFQSDFPALPLFPLLDSDCPLFALFHRHTARVHRDFYVIFPCVDKTRSLWDTRVYDKDVRPVWGLVTPRNKVYCFSHYNRKTVHRIVFETNNFKCALCEEWNPVKVCVACTECQAMYCEPCEEKHLGEYARGLSCVTERRKLPTVLRLPCPVSATCNAVKLINFKWRILKEPNNKARS